VNCREVLAKLYDYLDSELPAEEKNQVKSHLDLCGHCLEKYKLEEDFTNVVKRGARKPEEIERLKSKVLAQIEKIDKGEGGQSGGRNIIFLIAPLAAAAIITLFLVNPFSRQGSVLEVVYPYATEHSKCLDHVMKYLVQSQDPQVVEAALAGFGDVPHDLFPAPQADLQLAGATLAQFENGEKPHIDYHYKGSDVSIMVLDPNAIDKSVFRQVEHDGKTYFIGSCPKFHYVIWECEKHECIAVSKLDEDLLLNFASIF
jgi:mycothiol system anti-sigma-R factor